jgi:hypothetical protein
VNTKRGGPAGPQQTDPPWARLLFMVLEGREGQCWRAILLVTPLLLLMIGLFVVVVVAAHVFPAGWAGGVLGIGSLTAALALARGAGTRRR